MGGGDRGAGARGDLAKGEREEGPHRLLVHIAAVRHGHTLAAGEVGLGCYAGRGFPSSFRAGRSGVSAGLAGPREIRVQGPRPYKKKGPGSA